MKTGFGSMPKEKMRKEVHFMLWMFLNFQSATSDI